jgi:hypothetical protein
MIYTDNFSENITNSYIPVFRQNKVPIFQNKVYPSCEEALAAETGEVQLVQSLISGFIFNKAFAPQKMNYDVHYQNEQSNSNVFKDHLQSALKLLISFGINDKKLVEVGCGKGVFFEMMLAQGMDCWGFDPTYEGNNERIKKELFDETQNGMDVDVIIMRHTLEHITHPFSFLHTIANANNYKGYLFIEVPTFDWIVSKNSFWDIFYEHCNYFTEESLCVMFDEAASGHFFGGQYIYLWADLSKIRETIPDNVKFVSRSSLAFDRKINKYKNILNRFESFAIWGAGAKGSTFLNLLDKERQGVEYVIDINPSKQNKFIAGTGHAIFDPSILMKRPVKNILIMNENYNEEIRRQIDYFHVTPNIISL